MPRLSLRLLILGFCVCATRLDAQQYQITDLGTFGGSFSSAAAINASGQVVGSARISGSSASHPFLWQNGIMHDLGVLPGFSSCSATAINDVSQVVGTCFDPARSLVEAFIWSSTTGMQPLGTPPNAYPQGINSSGVVVGSINSPTIIEHAFSFHDGAYTDLGEGVARAINDAGQIVGRGPGPTFRAVMWDEAGRHDLTTDQAGVAFAISPGGLPVGLTDIDSQAIAVAFTADGIANLGTLGGFGSQAFGVRSGRIVGAARTSGGEQHAFVYDLNGPGVMVDLNDRTEPIPGWSVFVAWSINGDGAIAADGIDASNNTHAFLLTPLGTPTPTDNLLVNPGFEEYTPPHLGPPGWISDDFRQIAAFSETNQPRSGEKNGACWTTDNLDCGMFQDLTAPATGTYTLTIFANADRPGALVGANVGGETAVSADVAVRGFANYGDGYVLTFHANQGDPIRVWMYSPAVPGYLVIDDVVLNKPKA